MWPWVWDGLPNKYRKIVVSIEIEAYDARQRGPSRGGMQHGLPNNLQGAGMKIKNIMAVFCTFLLMLFAGAALHAQDISGTISGTVVDGTGAAVAGATVTITNTEKNDTHTATTNDHGEFTVPNLLVGHYTVTVEAKNFKKIEQKEIMLNV